MSSSILSFVEAQEQTLATADPFNFAPYMDQVCPFCILFSPIITFYSKKAPLTISNNSPLELLHQFFTKLGARYVIVTDTDGLCACKCSPFPPCIDLHLDEGVIEKKTWLAFVADLEEKS